MRHAALLLLIVAAGLLFGLPRCGVETPVPQTPPRGMQAEPEALAAAGPSALASELPERAPAPAAAAPTGPPVHTIVLRAIDAGSGDVLPHTEIAWIDAATTHRTTPAADLRPRDEEAFLRAVGALATTDARGRLQLQVHERLDLAARCGDRYVRRYWRPNSPPSTDPRFPGESVLRLQRDRTLSVRAVDAFGAPVADVTVWLSISARQPVGADSQSTLALAPTAADGTTQLRHAQELLGEPNVSAAHLRAQIAGAEGPLVPFDPAAPPEGPIDVPVPAFGSVLVELLGPSGEVWDVPGGVTFTLAPLGGAGHPEKAVHHSAAVGGRVLYERVGLHRRYRLSTNGDWVRDFDFDGPTVLRQQVHIPLQVPTGARVLTGRALGPDGAPCRESLAVRLEGVRSRTSGGVAIDRDGRFAVQVPAWLGDRFRLVLAASRGAQLEAVAELPNEPGIRDLGDLVLREPPVLVAGRVVGPGGAPWPAADGLVRLVVEQCDQAGGIWFSSGVGSSIGPDGAFVVRTHAGARRYRARVVVGDSGSCAPVEFAPGTAQLRLEIGQPGRR